MGWQCKRKELGKNLEKKMPNGNEKEPRKELNFEELRKKLGWG